MKRLQLYIPNISCMGCINKINTHLSQLKNIDKFSINFATKTAEVYFNEYDISSVQIIKYIAKIGYSATLTGEELEQTKHVQFNKEQNLLLVKSGIAFILGIFLMYLEMGHFSLLYNNFIYASLECVVVLIVILFTGSHIFKSAYLSTRNLSTNMHTLISMGIISAYIYSTIINLSTWLHLNLPHYSYFESALIIVALVDIGAYIEHKANHNTLSAINELFNLLPEQTTIVKNQIEQKISTSSLQPNDVIKIVAGDKIPCDGTVISGNGYVDESTLTGEAKYITKEAGSRVTGGTINQNGSFLFTATQIGDNTILSKIINLVKEAQNSKPKYAKLADNIAKIFVPCVILTAIISGFTWYYISNSDQLINALNVFMAVLIIACPCSIGLAIPMSLLVGLAKSAKCGVLFKKTDVISNINKINYILLDKTGTITEGKPQITKITSYDRHITDEQLINIAYALENHSKHPIARAIIQYATTFFKQITPIVVTNFYNETGYGISGDIGNITYYLGSMKYIKNKTAEINYSPDVNTPNSAIYLANSKNILGKIEIADKIKADSKSVIYSLQQMGFKLAIVTGDTLDTANHVGNLVGINEIYAQLSPIDKINVVKNLQNNGNHVIFVGDGINDAIALSQADMGIAIGSGSDVAIGSADVTLINNSLKGVVSTIQIAKAINKNMQQNLFGAFIYNGIAILIASGITYPLIHTLLNPMIASAAMSLSSITVILNATHLKVKKY